MVLSFFQKLQKRDRDTSIRIDGELLPVKVVENDRAKRLTLRILPGGDGLKVTTPSHVDDEEIETFITRNKNWAAAKIARLPEKVKLVPDAIVPFKNRNHKIVSSGKLRGLVEIVECDDMPLLRVPGSAEAVSRKLAAFFKREARKELDRCVQKHASAINVQPKQIRITDTTSRWGSCSSTRTLSFSWRIIMAPPEVLDYLVAHEVAHLVEMNHSSRFWKLTKQLCPDMEAHKSWLRTHGNKLHAISVD